MNYMSEIKQSLVHSPNVDDKQFAVNVYSLFINVDESILNLNPLIEKHGYIFEAVDLAELEKNFSKFFDFSRDESFQNQPRVQVNNCPGKTVSSQFMSMLQQNQFVSWNEWASGRIIFLKSLNKVNATVKGGVYDSTNVRKALSDCMQYVDSLLLQLRLFKHGYIAVSSYFGKHDCDNHVSPKTSNSLHSIWKCPPEFFHISEDEVLDLKETLNNFFEKKSVTNIAIDSFNLSYSNISNELRYLSLMICLESLFNVNGKEIAHTISRHLAIVVSSNEDEFKSNYSVIKKLYDYRSNIVHGRKTKEDSLNKIIELEGFVRKAINFFLKINLNQKELFATLNLAGWKLVI